MYQPQFFERQLWSVSELTRYLRDLLESDEFLQELWVHGEISNLSRPSSGHIYFTIKDHASSLKCVMWRNTAQRLSLTLREGQAVEVHGNISIYDLAGQYQLYADMIRPIGEGTLFQEFLRLKTRLEAEGLFNPARKKPIPRFPQKIGIVTSPTGAALRDILNTIHRRFPALEIFLASSSVQGENAPAELIQAINSLNDVVRPDVILLARGGGSIEDLWAFNDESLARSIASSSTPIISGIGHETDFTIADFVSDLRAATPTAAAELATPNRLDLIANLSDASNRIYQTIGTILSSKRQATLNLSRQLIRSSPLSRVRSNRQSVDDRYRRLSDLLAYRYQIERTRMTGLQHSLFSLNPLAILKRGYAVVTALDGRIISSTQLVHPKEELGVTVQDGSFPVVVGSASDESHDPDG